MKILLNELLNYKISLFFILVATYVSTTFELTIPLLLANALNIGIIENYGLEYIKNIAIMMLTLILITVALNILINFLIIRVSTHISSNIRGSFFSKVLSLKSNELTKFSTASLITRTNQDIDQMKNFIANFLSTIFKAPILLLSSITILKTLNSNFFLIIFIAGGILILFLIIIALKLLPQAKKLQSSIDNLNKNLKEKITGHKIIKSYNNIDLENNKFENSNKEYFNISKRILKTTSLINPFLTLIVNIVTISILLICLNLIEVNSIEAGTIIATIQYLLQILLSVVMISIITISFPTMKISLNRINDVLKCQSHTEGDEIKSFEIENISLENVSLEYNNTFILNNINLTINKNENVGIIGSNGSGKSTLAKLLIKELEPKEGTIKINDTDIKELTRKDITSNLTYVSQTPYILKGTILENISFANSNLTMPDIAKIIHTCNLENFIANKKENLNYQIEEGGANLSGGQKQRLSLARALAKDDNLMVLDEPFSALDYKTEGEILFKLKQLYPNKSLVIISQRISSIKNCDKIFVMDKGKIISFGTHEYLLNNCPVYQDIYHTQKEIVEYDN